MVEEKKKGTLETLQSEYRKITWPTKEEIVTYTTTVIGVSILVSAVIFVFDQLFSQGLGLLLK